KDGMSFDLERRRCRVKGTFSAPHCGDRRRACGSCSDHLHPAVFRPADARSRPTNKAMMRDKRSGARNRISPYPCVKWGAMKKADTEMAVFYPLDFYRRTERRWK